MHATMKAQTTVCRTLMRTSMAEVRERAAMAG
jgi:hypothetical protein